MQNNKRLRSNSISVGNIAFRVHCQDQVVSSNTAKLMSLIEQQKKTNENVSSLKSLNYRRLEKQINKSISPPRVSEKLKLETLYEKRQERKITGAKSGCIVESQAQKLEEAVNQWKEIKNNIQSSPHAHSKPGLRNRSPSPVLQPKKNKETKSKIMNQNIESQDFSKTMTSSPKHIENHNEPATSRNITGIKKYSIHSKINKSHQNKMNQTEHDKNLLNLALEAKANLEKCQNSRKRSETVLNSGPISVNSQSNTNISNIKKAQENVSKEKSRIKKIACVYSTTEHSPLSKAHSRKKTIKLNYPELSGVSVTFPKEKVISRKEKTNIEEIVEDIEKEPKVSEITKLFPSKEKAQIDNKG